MKRVLVAPPFSSPPPRPMHASCRYRTPLLSFVLYGLPPVWFAEQHPHQVHDGRGTAAGGDERPSSLGLLGYRARRGDEIDPGFG